MDKAAQETTDFYELVAWLHKNRQRVITVVAIIAVLGAAYGFYVWHGDYVESSANDALSNVKLPNPQENAAVSSADAGPFMKVADEHPGTAAGARALLISAGILFDAGKFDQSKSQFDKFLAQYPDNALATQASLGVAASLEAQGKIAEATSRYEDIVKRHSSSPVIPQAKSALARLYVAQNKPEMALQIYQELVRANNNDSWSAEASTQLEELLAKHPELRKPAPTANSAMPLSTPGASSTVTIPTAPQK